MHRTQYVRSIVNERNGNVPPCRGSRFCPGVDVVHARGIGGGGELPPGARFSHDGRRREPRSSSVRPTRRMRVREPHLRYRRTRTARASAFPGPVVGGRADLDASVVSRRCTTGQTRESRARSCGAAGLLEDGARFLWPPRVSPPTFPRRPSDAALLHPLTSPYSGMPISLGL